MKYPTLSDAKILSEGKGRAVEKVIDRLHKNIQNGRKMPRGFVPFLDQAKIADLEDEFIDAQNDDSLGNPEAIRQKGEKAATAIAKKFKGQIMQVQNNGVLNKDSVRFLIWLAGNINNKNAAESINKYLVPNLGDAEFLSFGKPRIISRGAGDADVEFPIVSTILDVELPIN
jgi:hypothetical protein